MFHTPKTLLFHSMNSIQCIGLGAVVNELSSFKKVSGSMVHLRSNTIGWISVGYLSIFDSFISKAGPSIEEADNFQLSSLIILDMMSSFIV